MFIIRSQGRTALVDTGGGPHLDATAGKLFENAAAAGVKVEDIDTILFTHIHPDHVSGLLDAKNRQSFSERESKRKMARSENLFWLSDKPASKEIEHIKHEADHVIRFLTPYADQIEPFVDGGVPRCDGGPPARATRLVTRAISSSRATTNSSSGAISYTGRSCSSAGRTQRCPTTSIRSRQRPHVRRILEESSSNGRLVAGMHLFFPGLTRVRRDGDAFAMVPFPWGHADAIRSLQGQESATGK